MYDDCLSIYIAAVENTLTYYTTRNNNIFNYQKLLKKLLKNYKLIHKYVRNRFGDKEYKNALTCDRYKI